MPLGFRVSIVANIALLALAIVLFSHEPSAEPLPATPPVRVANPVATSLRTTAQPPRSAQIPGVVARLERAGVSRIVLADIVRTDHRRRWGKRVTELENKYAPKQPPQREYITLKQLEEEDETRELKQALGEDGYAAWDKEATLRMLNFEEVPMNPAETEQAYRLQKQLEDKLREMRVAMEDGDADIADAGTLQGQAQDAYEKELEKLLGKDRYQQLKGYTIPVVEGHLEFNELSPSPEQVAALKSAYSDYQAREAELANRLSDKPTDAASIASQLKALNDAREENIRKTLGADAYEALKREHDDTYQTLTQFAPAWNLKDNEIEPVYQQLKTYTDNVDRLRKAAQMTELAGQTADWNAVNAAIEQSRRQTEAALQNLIGTDRVGAIVRNGLLSPLGSDRNAPHGGG